MIARRRTLAQLTDEAIRILCRELGPSDTIRFINQYRMGSGDYSHDRDEWQKNLTVKDIVTGIKQMKEAREKQGE